MQGAKEKAKDLVSSAKAKVKEQEAKVEEKLEKATARSEVQKEIAHERSKAKIAEAKMEMHAEKVQHREESMMRHRFHRHDDVGVQPVHHDPGPILAPAFPTYPVSGAHPVTKK
ncbi:late embryogenesis abundant protein D-113 [Carex littledalei]|uniref:Late embryogenesis abundant protein D-113 n=1 Tax=Carex littledalei TaxID=544730 RepID=A0A833QS93_9POAL|nr:late embryogenesis abundant protein D-113 [Carex littledalei]